MALPRRHRREVEVRKRSEKTLSQHREPVNFIVRVALQKHIPAVGPGRRGVLPLHVVGEDDLRRTVDSLVIGRVVPRGSLRTARVELRCFHIEINVLIIHMFDGVGLDPESYDSDTFVLLRASLDRSMHRNNYLDVIEEKMLVFSRLVLLPKPNRKAAHVIGSRGIHLIRQQRTRG